MSKERRYLQKIAAVLDDRSSDLPKPLEDLSEMEAMRKRVIGRVMTHVLSYLTCEFVENGFEWLLPVILSQSTDPLWPDQNASIEKRLEVEIYGKTVQPTASMIVHKLVVCSLAHPRIFVLSPNVRIEKRERACTGKHAYEFTQLDFEVRDATSEAIRHFIEGLICRLIDDLNLQMGEELSYLRQTIDPAVPTRPFRVCDREELEKEYGREWESRVVSESRDPVWVTNIPREFYDFQDPESGAWDNYDLFLPKYGEVLSGAKREFEYDKMMGKMERDNVKKENYETLLRLARKGRIRPSAGAGIGIERLIGWVVEAGHVGEVQLFPRIPGTVYEL